MFKGKAGKVANALKALKSEELSGDVIQLTIDGEKIEINKNSVKFETVTEEVHGENIIPHVIEPSFGIDRITYSLLEHSYFEEEVKEKVEDAEEGEEEKRIVLRLPPEVAPVQAAVLPLLSREELIKPGTDIVNKLRKAGSSLRSMIQGPSAGGIGEMMRSGLRIR